MNTVPRSLLLLPVVALALADEPAKKAVIYFPTSKDGERKNGVISSFESEWYSKHLSVMGEPSLYPPRDGVIAFRLLILPTWGHPIAVRAEIVGGACKLISRRLDGQGGYDPGKVAEAHEVTLTQADTATLTKLLDALNMFERPTEDGHSGLDGDQWIFEGVTGGRYHILNLWCAGDEVKKRGLEPFIAVCRFLIGHSKLTENPKNQGHELLPAK